jgi:hypothetical protein
VREAIEEVIGPTGRMISASKTAPKGHLCGWNANIIVDGSKIWFGDIDITKDQKKLDKLAKDFGKDIYVVRERDARFANESKPVLTDPLYVARA